MAAVESTAPSCSASGLTPIGGSAVEIAIRSRPGSVAAAAASEGPPSAITSMISAASLTVRVSGPNTAMPWCASFSGAEDTRPRCGLRPNSAVHAAGMRIEPAPSEPSAALASPAATAVAEPPLEPPLVRCGSHGLRVTPNVGDSVNGCRHQLRDVRLADDHGAGGAQARDDLGVGGPGLRVGVAAVGGDLAGHVHVVLDRDRDAVQGRRSGARRPRRPRPAPPRRARRGRRSAAGPGGRSGSGTAPSAPAR